MGSTDMRITIFLLLFVSLSSQAGLIYKFDFEPPFQPIGSYDTSASLNSDSFSLGFGVSSLGTFFSVSIREDITFFGQLRESHFTVNSYDYTRVRNGRLSLTATRRWNPGYEPVFNFNLQPGETSLIGLPGGPFSTTLLLSDAQLELMLIDTDSSVSVDEPKPALVLLTGLVCLVCHRIIEYRKMLRISTSPAKGPF